MWPSSRSAQPLVCVRVPRVKLGLCFLSFFFLSSDDPLGLLGQCTLSLLCGLPRKNAFWPGSTQGASDTWEIRVGSVEIPAKKRPMRESLSWVPLQLGMESWRLRWPGICCHG